VEPNIITEPKKKNMGDIWKSGGTRPPPNCAHALHDMFQKYIDKKNFLCRSWSGHQPTDILREGTKEMIVICCTWQLNMIF